MAEKHWADQQRFIFWRKPTPLFDGFRHLWSYTTHMENGTAYEIEVRGSGWARDVQFYLKFLGDRLVWERFFAEGGLRLTDYASGGLRSGGLRLGVEEQGEFPVPSTNAVAGP